MQTAADAQRRDAGRASRQAPGQGALVPWLSTSRTLSTTLASKTPHESLYIPNPSSCRWLHHIWDRCEQRHESLWLGLASYLPLSPLYLRLFDIFFFFMIPSLSWQGEVLKYIEFVFIKWAFGEVISYSFVVVQADHYSTTFLSESVVPI